LYHHFHYIAFRPFVNKKKLGGGLPNGEVGCFCGRRLLCQKLPQPQSSQATLARFGWCVRGRNSRHWRESAHLPPAPTRKPAKKEQLSALLRLSTNLGRC